MILLVSPAKGTQCGHDALPGRAPRLPGRVSREQGVLRHPGAGREGERYPELGRDGVKVVWEGERNPVPGRAGGGGGQGG